MTRCALGLLAALLLAPLGCDLRAFLLETDALPGQREAAARVCCNCVAERVAIDPADQCAPLSDDAGTPDDDGGVLRSRCLCDAIDGAQCAELLLSGGDISLLSGCVAAGGTCHAACDGVLAYP